MARATSLFRIIYFDRFTNPVYLQLSADGQRVFDLAYGKQVTTALPGLVRCGYGRVIEEIRDKGKPWSDRRAKSALRECDSAGLVVSSSDDGVIFVPGVIEERAPGNKDSCAPMVRVFAELPSCTARDRWLDELDRLVDELRAVESGDKKATKDRLKTLQGAERLSGAIYESQPDLARARGQRVPPPCDDTVGVHKEEEQDQDEHPASPRSIPTRDEHSALPEAENKCGSPEQPENAPDRSKGIVTDYGAYIPADRGADTPF